MVCPYCEFEFGSPASQCPECGIRIVRQVSGIIKISTVMIGAGNQNRIYRSVQDVPEPLRQRLIDTTSSENSGMIVIADRAGKEQWTEVVAHRESHNRRQAAAIPEAAPSVRGIAGLSWASWAGILLFLAAVAMIAFVFQVFHR